MKVLSGGFLWLCSIVAFGGWSVKYVFETWIPFIVHHSVNMPWIAAIIAGFFVGTATIPLAIVTWLLRLCGVLG